MSHETRKISVADASGGIVKLPVLLLNDALSYNELDFDGRPVNRELRREQDTRTADDGGKRDLDGSVSFESLFAGLPKPNPNQNNRRGR